MVLKKGVMWGFTVAVSLFVTTHFVSLSIESEFLFQLFTVLGLCTLFFALVLLRGKAAVLPLFLLSFAIVVSLVSDISIPVVFWEGATLMKALVAMMVIIPVVGWVLKQENYVEDTIILLKKWLTSSKPFYFVLIFVTQLISFFLLIGSVAVVYQIIQTFFSRKQDEAWKMFKSTAVLRGFGLAMFWVISIPSFAYSVETLDASLAKTLAQGFCIAIAGLILAVLYLHFYEKKEKATLSSDIRNVIAEAAEKVDIREKLHRNPLEFLFLFISLMIMTLVANAILPFGLLTVIPFVIVIWAVIYFITKRKQSALWHEIKEYITKGMAFRAQEISVFMSAGILITALNTSGISEQVMQAIYEWTDGVPGLNFLFVLPLIILFFGFVGIGPLTVMVLLAGIVQSIHLPYPTELVVLSMTLGSALSVMTSPLVMASIFLSSLNRLSSFENSVKNNWKFAIGLYIVVELYIQFRILMM